jgi:DeoR/GlpR family transcriptional regulator of sugar metabolism
MLPAQRKQFIMDYLTKHGGATIAALSEMLGVSEMTVRRDLRLMEEQGAVRRAYGGAMAVNDRHVEPRYEEKKNNQLELKDRIAKYAAKQFVRNDSVIILEAGTTVARMSDELAQYSGLNILTNGLHTLTSIKKLLPHASILSCGGMLRDVSYTFVGPTAETFFQQVHAHYLFVSASGFTTEHGFTDPNMLEIAIKRAMSASARKTVMLMDSTKLGSCSLQTTFQPSEVDIVVTDEGADESILQFMREEGIEVHIV